MGTRTRAGNSSTELAHQHCGEMERSEGSRIPRGTVLRAAIGLVFLGATTLVSWSEGLRPCGDALTSLGTAQLVSDMEDGSSSGIAASFSTSDLEGDEHEESAGRASLLLNGGIGTATQGEIRHRRAFVPRGVKADNRPIVKNEPAMLTDFKKEPLDFLDLDDVQDGWLWIPVSIEKFDSSTADPLVKMCPVNYGKYSDAPWLLPMGGLLSLDSGCSHLNNVQLVRLSLLERLLEDSVVPTSKPTGFIFHETRCGSTLVANMLASVRSNVMWSESTGPWKVMHTCPSCQRDQIVRFLKVVMDAMLRSPYHEHFYFKFQSSEDIEAVTAAYPDVPWIFLYREPVEVMMSRLGAQRIGMEGMEKEVAARVEKGMNTGNNARVNLRKTKSTREVATANQLLRLCKKAIAAFESNPNRGMMVEYPHLPNGIVDTVLPDHFNVHISREDYERMMNTTQKYSKVSTFHKAGTPESKFIEDTDTKHLAASMAVTDTAKNILYSEYYKLKSLESWHTS